MRVELRPISSIHPYPNNPRVNQLAVDALAKSIQTFGFRQPIVVDDDDVIIVGHTRYLAALKLDLELVPVHVVADLTPSQVKAYRLADNQLHSFSDWDDQKLSSELAQLQGMDIDLSVTGFSADELVQLLGPRESRSAIDLDLMPGLSGAARTRRGDLWRLGSHRLLCGDSTRPEDLDRLLEGEAVQLVTTFPPANVPINLHTLAAEMESPSSEDAHRQAMDRRNDLGKPRRRCSKHSVRNRSTIKNDFHFDAESNSFLYAWLGNSVRTLDPGRSFYFWGGYGNIANFPPVLEAHGMHLSQVLIWDRQHSKRTRKDFRSAHGCGLYGWKTGAPHRFFGPTDATDLWSIPMVTPQSKAQQNEIPVELAVRTLQFSSQPGENVLDPFGGCGSVMMAAEQIGRRAFLLELDPWSCDIALSRYERITGNQAQRD